MTREQGQCLYGVRQERDECENHRIARAIGLVAHIIVTFQFKSEPTCYFVFEATGEDADRVARSLGKPVKKFVSQGETV